MPNRLLTNFQNKRLSGIVFRCWKTGAPIADAVHTVKPSAIHRLFYDRSELRAIWRLLIFLSIVVTLIYANNLTVRWLLHSMDNTTLFLVREVMDFLIFLFTSWI